MAIGHEPEVGLKFGGYKLDEHGTMLDIPAMYAHYKEWKERVGEDLLGGWAKLIRRGDGSDQTAVSPTRDTATVPEDELSVRSVHEAGQGEGSREVDVAIPTSGEGHRPEADQELVQHRADREVEG